MLPSQMRPGGGGITVTTSGGLSLKTILTWVELVFPQIVWEALRIRVSIPPGWLMLIGVIMSGGDCDCPAGIVTEVGSGLGRKSDWGAVLPGSIARSIT